MEKRDLIDRIFIAICALTLVSVFLPCNELDKVKNGITIPQYSSILDGQAGFIHILLPVAAAFMIMIGKRVIASLIAFASVGFNAFSVYYFWDQGEYAVNTFAAGSKLSEFYRYAGYEGCTNINPFGFYLAVVAMSLLLLVAIVNLVIKE